MIYRWYLCFYALYLVTYLELIRIGVPKTKNPTLTLKKVKMHLIFFMKFFPYNIESYLNGYVKFGEVILTLKISCLGGGTTYYEVRALLATTRAP